MRTSTASVSALARRRAELDQLRRACDAELAALLNEGLTDPVLAKALLYDRNERWAEWIDTRLDEPGTVFVAVGAGHLAGAMSVQDYLTGRGLAVTRVQ